MPLYRKKRVDSVSLLSLQHRNAGKSRRKPLIQCVGDEEEEEEEELSSSSSDSTAGEEDSASEEHVEMDIALGVVSHQCHPVWHDRSIVLCLHWQAATRRQESTHSDSCVGRWHCCSFVAIKPFCFLPLLLLLLLLFFALL